MVDMVRISSQLSFFLWFPTVYSMHWFLPWPSPNHDKWRHINANNLCMVIDTFAYNPDIHQNGIHVLHVPDDDNPKVSYPKIDTHSISKWFSYLRTQLIATWFSRLFFTTTWNSNRCLSARTCYISFMCTWIALTTMTFTKAFMSSTIERFPTTCLTGWTISIATLRFVKSL